MYVYFALHIFTQSFVAANIREELRGRCVPMFVDTELFGFRAENSYYDNTLHMPVT
jgi:hypothetical protein